MYRDALLIRAKLIWEAQSVDRDRKVKEDDSRGLLGGLLQVACAAGSLETVDGVALIHLDSSGRRLVCEQGKWVVVRW